MFYDGIIQQEVDLNAIKSGEYSYIGEKLTSQKIMSNDFEATGVCNMYLTTKPLLQLPFGMIFQVITNTYLIFKKYH